MAKLAVSAPMIKPKTRRDLNTNGSAAFLWGLWVISWHRVEAGRRQARLAQVAQVAVAARVLGYAWDRW